MIIQLYRAYKTGKTIYTYVLKPIYEELRRDAYATEDETVIKRKRKTQNAKDKKPERSNRRKKDPK
jgi:hypothetical protein